jgi:hypothetical protein
VVNSHSASNAPIKILRGILLCGLFFFLSSDSSAQQNQRSTAGSSTDPNRPIFRSSRQTPSFSSAVEDRGNDRLADNHPTPFVSESYFDASLDPTPELNWESRIGQANGTRVGYDDGFVIAGQDIGQLGGDDAPFRLRMNGWGQLRVTNFVSANDSSDVNQIQLKRARLIFSGHAFTSDFSYFIALDGQSTSSNAIRLLDYFLTYDVGHHTLNAEKRVLMLKVGQYKIPFTLARAISGQQFQFTDRSVASMFFDANRSLAFGAYGEGNPGGQLVTWEAAIFNGLVTGGSETGSAGTLDNNFAFSSRLAAYPTGQWGPDALCDYDYHDAPATRIGAAFATSEISRLGSTEFNSIRVVDSGAQIGTLLPADAQSYLASMYSVDASLKYRGLSFTSEYYFRNINRFVGISQSGLLDHGFSLEAGYFILSQKLELLTRWSRVVGDSGTLGSKVQSSDEKAVGAVWYFRRHSAKLTVDATYLDGAPVSSFALDIDPGNAGWLMRTQVQFSF